MTTQSLHLRRCSQFHVVSDIVSITSSFILPGAFNLLQTHSATVVLLHLPSTPMPFNAHQLPRQDTDTQPTRHIPRTTVPQRPPRSPSLTSRRQGLPSTPKPTHTHRYVSKCHHIRFQMHEIMGGQKIVANPAWANFNTVHSSTLSILPHEALEEM